MQRRQINTREAKKKSSECIHIYTQTKFREHIHCRMLFALLFPKFKVRRARERRARTINQVMSARRNVPAAAGCRIFPGSRNIIKQLTDGDFLRTRVRV